MDESSPTRTLRFSQSGALFHTKFKLCKVTLEFDLRFMKYFYALVHNNTLEMHIKFICFFSLAENLVYN